MWTVLEHRRVRRHVRRIPLDVLKRYEKWKDIVEASGPPGLRLIKGFHDEALRGTWQGCRSSRLNRQYRIIYRIEPREILVEVIDVTAHDYKKK